MKDYIAKLDAIFQSNRDKYAAHRASVPVLEKVAADNSFMTGVLRNYVSNAENLNRANFPVPGINLELNPYYNLVVNCWIPLATRQTNVSTKAIHHHGNMLLTTATAFGPGYEHWLMSDPEPIDAARNLYAMTVKDRGRHPRGNVAFVDANVPHLPMYAPELSITLALWSSNQPVTWKDRVKRIPALKANEKALKATAKALGLAKSLDLKIPEYFDYYPTAEGFVAVRERKEHDLGPNADHLQSLFHLIQGTGNAALADDVERTLNSGAKIENAQLVRSLIADLRARRPIEGKISDCHLKESHLKFTSEEIESAVNASTSFLRDRTAATV
jgi:hypothetical protein